MVTWIYYQDASHIIENNTDAPWNVVLEKIFVNMAKRKNFYRSAFEEHGQNALIDYIVEHDILIYRRKLKENLNVDVLDKDLLFSIEYHAYACAHITKNWLCNGAEKPQAKELANLL